MSLAIEFDLVMAKSAGHTSKRSPLTDSMENYLKANPGLAPDATPRITRLN